MDDADRARWHASRIRKCATELDQALPGREWVGPTELECRLRVLEVRDRLIQVARLLELGAYEHSP